MSKMVKGQKREYKGYDLSVRPERHGGWVLSVHLNGRGLHVWYNDQPWTAEGLEEGFKEAVVWVDELGG